MNVQGKLAEQLEGGGVCPLQVLEQQDNRPGGATTRVAEQVDQLQERGGEAAGICVRRRRIIMTSGVELAAGPQLILAVKWLTTQKC